MVAIEHATLPYSESKLFAWDNIETLVRLLRCPLLALDSTFTKCHKAPTQVLWWHPCKLSYDWVSKTMQLSVNRRPQLGHKVTGKKVILVWPHYFSENQHQWRKVSEAYLTGQKTGKASEPRLFFSKKYLQKNW